MQNSSESTNESHSDSQQPAPLAATISGVAGRYFVRFPYALKNNFRLSFPSARWHPDMKAWSVGPRSKSRLEGWVEIVNASGIAEAQAELEALELSNEEKRQLIQAIEQAQRGIASAKDSARATAVECSRLLETLGMLDSKKAQLAIARADASEKAQQKAALEESITERLEQVVDVKALKSCAQEMRKWHKHVGYPARDHFDECQANFREARSALKRSGLSLRAIDWCAEANFNRPDRDGVEHMPSNAWFDVRELAPAEC